MILFDSHCHLTDEAFADDAPEALDRARRAGVAGVALCGYDEPSNAGVLRLAEGRAGVYPTVGFHPHEAKDITPAMLAGLESLVALPQVVGVGELGLDFYRNHSGSQDQRRVLEAQLAMAVRHGKPVCVHSRAAEDAIFEQLEPFAREFADAWPGRAPGVMHCFGGTLEQARRYVDLGFMVSVACTVTYPKNADTHAIAAGLPLDTLVIETDSPYLPPQRLRGQRNEPAHVAAAAEAIAALRRLAPAAVAEQTTRNAERLFGVHVPVEVAAR